MFELFMKYSRILKKMCTFKSIAHTLHCITTILKRYRRNVSPLRRHSVRRYTPDPSVSFSPRVPGA